MPPDGRTLGAYLEALPPSVRRIRDPYRRLRRALRPWSLARARGRIEGNGVALTFDDGPHPTYTDDVLDVLASRSVTATFFVVGKRARQNPRVIRRILDEGHAVASHSMTHTDPWRLGALALWRDYRAGHLEVSNVVGRDVRLFRPPKGHLDRRSAVAIRAAGLQSYLWTLDAADWEPDLRPEDVVSRLGRPAAGDVILLHDAIEGPMAPRALDRSAMIAGLTRFLDAADGIRFVTLLEAGETNE